MSYTDDELESGLCKIAEELVVLISNFEKETSHQVVEVPIFRDNAGNLSCQLKIILSGSATMLKKGAMDS